MKFNPLRRSTADTTAVTTPNPSAPGTPGESASNVGHSTNASGTNTPRTNGNYSARASFARERSAYNSMPMEELDRLQGNMMLSCLAHEQRKSNYISYPCEPNEGVIVRTPHSNMYMCQPPSLQEHNDPLWEVAQELRLKVSYLRLIPSSVCSLTVGSRYAGQYAPVSSPSFLHTMTLTLSP